MRFLLDTHTFIWLESNASALSLTASNFINDPTNELFLSHVSVWEIQVKTTIGKLKSQTTLERRINLAQSKARLLLLPIKLEHIYVLGGLPLHHRDPFDRMLIAQSISEGLPIVSRDSALKQYPVVVVW